MKNQSDQLCFSPTDLANHLACKHLTELERQVAVGEIESQYNHDPMLELLIELGKRHEDAYLKYLSDSGNSIVSFQGSQAESVGDSVVKAMKSGTDVITQAPMTLDRWSGRSDFLLKVDVPSELGDWSYEVADTKLAQNTRATTVLQLCMYSEFVSVVQGTLPTFMHIVKPGKPFDCERLRVAEYMAYYRMAKNRFLDHMNQPAKSVSYPDPCSHCEICNWSQVCESEWRQDDHLTFVAGMPKSQITELRSLGIGTLTKFSEAEKPHPGVPNKGSIESFAKSQRQAKIQLKGRRSGKPEYEFNAIEKARGFLLLPEPCEGDVFFDIEGNPRESDGGLEYLFGFVNFENSELTYKQVWALDKKQEKKMFETFIDQMLVIWNQHPGMHIFHFAPYEPSALKRLALRHATREDELDRLLRGERFVDLYAVSRQGITASVESYSIKQLEQFYGYERQESLKAARSALRDVERLIELNLISELTDQQKNVVVMYNQDDCLSTLALRNWLESLRSDMVESGYVLPRPDQKEGDPGDQQAQMTAETKQVFDALVAGINDVPADQPQMARWLLAHLLEYFRREAKCNWWEYFRLKALEFDEQMLERAAIAGLDFHQEFPPEGRSNIPIHQYRYPSQDTTIKQGDSLYDDDGNNWGAVVEIDYSQNLVDVKKRKDSIDHHPASAFAFNFVNAKPMPESLLTFAQLILNELATGDTTPSARFDLLANNPPRLKTLSLPLTGESIAVAQKLAMDLDNSILPIQGPPGSGKTFVGSHMIIALAKAGKKVGVTAVSHKVILNLLEGVVNESAKAGQISVAHHCTQNIDDINDGIVLSKSSTDSLDFLEKGFVIGGTAWLWSSLSMESKLDYLFIDEAGQMSLAMALAAGRAAKNIILLGDPQQLEQPQQGTHPEGSGVAALSHLLNGNETIAETKGIFLNDTWRLHPAICEFTSELYYDNRLKSRPNLEQQTIIGKSEQTGSGLRFISVEHSGNQNRSDEEVAAISKLVKQLMDGQHTWMNASGETKPLTLADIVIVAPFNAQVMALVVSLPKGARVGTVDKFQGQEAPVVIYSMTSSSAQDAPRGMAFLYSRNRMNVATSRARCLVFVVASPKLLEPDCNSPEQIRLANGLCRFFEFAKMQNK